MAPQISRAEHMIQARSIVQVADNTGAKIVQCFKVLGGTKKRYASIGDIIIGSVKESEPRKLVRKKEIVRGVVVRQRGTFRRKDGTYIRFDDNAIVIIDANNEPRGGRVFGPIPREIREKGFTKIIGLAEEVV